MKKKSIVVLISSIIVCASLLITGAATLNEFTQDKVNAQAQTIDFADVKESDWFYDDVKYVQANKLMTGTSDTDFSPSGVTTRGMIVTILWRLDGEPVVEGKEFEDVSKDAYYYNAVAWASNNQIVSGYSDTVFGPNDTATREQLATIMNRYASYKKYDVSKEAELDKYTDKDQISEYAVKSLKWANANGLITGTSEETISPKDDVQRCQVAAILRRLCEKYEIIKDEAPEEKSDEQPVDNKDTNKSEENDEEVNIGGGSSSSSSSSGVVIGGNEEDNEDGSSLDTSNEREDNTPVVTIDSVTAGPGEEVQVAVKVKNNPGILGMTLSLYYDESKCTLESATIGSAVENVLNLTTSKSLGNGVRFVWDGIEITTEDVKNGDILLLKFKINKNAQEGKTHLTLKCFDGDVIDNDLNNIPLIVENGYINIK